MKILAIGAHPDDVELGCGGTLALYQKRGHQVYVLVLTLGEASGDAAVRENECRLATTTIGVHRLIFGNLADTRITDGIETITAIENTINTVSPDIIFTHSAKDAHQDHRNTHRASLSAARHKDRILLYESPAALSEFCPQIFVDITSTVGLKLKAVALYDSQNAKPYMNGRLHPEDPCNGCEKREPLSIVAAGLARFRGFQAGLGSAEAFEVAKYVLDIKAIPTAPQVMGDQEREGRTLSCTTTQTSLT